MKYLLAITLCITLIGCAADQRVYDSGIAKHPFVLTLHDDGRYQLEHMFMDKGIELGRWTTVLRDSEMEVVLLQPDDASQKKRYAYLVDPEENPISLRLYDDYQSVLTYHLPASGSSGFTPPSYPYKR